MSTEKNNPNQYRDRWLLLLITTVMSIGIIVGLIFVLQHALEEEKSDQGLENQKAILKNQDLLNQLINEIRTHENKEEKMIDEKTAFGNDISLNNSKKLDEIITFLYEMYPHPQTH